MKHYWFSENIKVGLGKPPCASPDDMIQILAKFNNGSFYVTRSMRVGSASKCHDSLRHGLM